MTSDGQGVWDRASAGTLWKEDWPRTQRNHVGWWNHKDLVLWVTAPKDRAWEEVAAPTGKPTTLEGTWYDANWKARLAEYRLSRIYFGGDSFPLYGTWTGAGDLAAYLGCPTQLCPTTVWYHPTITDPDSCGPLRMNHQSDVLQKHLALVRRGMELARGRFMVSLPDIIENVDILAALRGTENLMMDMIERPEWVEQKVEEINAAFFEAFDLFHELVHDVDGGNTFVFDVWGPGKTCKVQCDACSMFGPEMFRRFVVPALKRQCAWLDYAMFHLDGDDCLPNLEALLEIAELKAIEWTPKLLSVGDSGGHPRHHELYRRILRAGKSVQAIGVKYEEVIPLLDAVGGAGMYISTQAESEEAARKLEERVKAYRGRGN